MKHKTRNDHASHHHIHQGWCLQLAPWLLQTKTNVHQSAWPLCQPLHRGGLISQEVVTDQWPQPEERERESVEMKFNSSFCLRRRLTSGLDIHMDVSLYDEDWTMLQWKHNLKKMMGNLCWVTAISAQAVTVIPTLKSLDVIVSSSLLFLVLCGEGIVTLAVRENNTQHTLQTTHRTSKCQLFRFPDPASHTHSQIVFFSKI